MAVTIELSGQLLPGTPRKRNLEIAHPMRVEDVARSIGLAPDDVGLVVIDGVQGEMEALVPPDCKLSFFPYLAGG